MANKKTTISEYVQKLKLDISSSDLQKAEEAKKKLKDLYTVLRQFANNNENLFSFDTANAHTNINKIIKEMDQLAASQRIVVKLSKQIAEINTLSPYTGSAKIDSSGKITTSKAGKVTGKKMIAISSNPNAKATTPNILTAQTELTNLTNGPLGANKTEKEQLKLGIAEALKNENLLAEKELQAIQSDIDGHLKKVQLEYNEAGQAVKAYVDLTIDKYHTLRQEYQRLETERKDGSGIVDVSWAKATDEGGDKHSKVVYEAERERTDLLKDYNTELNKKYDIERNLEQIQRKGGQQTDVEKLKNELALQDDIVEKQYAKLEANTLVTQQDIQSAQKQAEQNSLQKEQNELLQEYKNLTTEIVKEEKQKAQNAAAGTTNQAQLDRLNEYQKRLETTRGKIKDVSALTDIDAKRTHALALEQEKLNNNLNRTGVAFGGWSKRLKTAAQNTLIYGTLYKAFNLTNQATRKAIELTRELDTAMTSLQMVTMETDAQTRSLMKSYAQLGQELGATTQEVADGALEWLRQGKSAEDTAKLLKASMMLSKVGAMEASEATEKLTATMNGFGLSVDEAVRAIDKFVAVDLNFATSSEEIATALQYVASSAKEAGLSIDHLIGLVTVGSENTRLSAETIGNAWKTLVTRMHNVTIGKDLDDEGESLNNVETILKQFNIEMRNSQGDWRDLGDVINDIGSIWNTLTGVQKNAIATQVSGTRQANIFISTMNDYEKVMKATSISTNSAGQATEKYQQYLESIDAKVATLSATWEELVLKIKGEGTYADIIDFCTEFIKWLDVIINDFHGLQAILIAVGTIGLVKLTKGIQTLYQSASRFQFLLDEISKVAQTTEITDVALTNLGKQMTGLNSKTLIALLSQQKFNEAQIEQILTSAGVETADQAVIIQKLKLKGAIDGTTKSQVTLNAVLKMNPFLAIAAAITVVVGAYALYQKKQKELISSAKEASEAYSEQADSLEDFEDRYKELVGTRETYAELTKEEQLELYSLAESFNDTYGTAKNKIDIATQSLEEQLDVIKEIRKENARNYQIEHKKEIETAQKKYGKNQSAVVSLTGSASTQAAVNTIMSQYGFSMSDMGADNKALSTWTQEGNLKTVLQQSEKAYNELIKIWEQSSGIEKEFLWDFISQLHEQIVEYKELYQDVFPTVAQNAITKIRMQSDAYDKFVDALQKYWDALETGTPEQIESAKDLVNDTRKELQIEADRQMVDMSTLEEAAGADGDSIVKHNEAIKASYDDLMNNTVLSPLIEKIKELNITEDEFKQSIADGTGENVKLFTTLRYAAEEMDISYNDLIEVLTRFGIVAESSAAKSEKKFEDTASAIKDLSSAYSKLKSITKEYNKQGYITLDSLDDLIDLVNKYGASLDDLITVTEDGAKFNRNNYIAMMTKELEALAGTSTEANEIIQALKKNLTTHLNNLDKHEKFTEVYDELQRKRNRDQISAKEYYEKLASYAKKYYKDNAEYAKEYQEIYDEIYEGLKSEEENRLKSQLSIIEDAIDEKIEALNKEKEALKETADSEDALLKVEKARDAYENAKKQKTTRVYTATAGWQWVADQEKIQEAAEDLQEAEKDYQEQLIDDEIKQWETLKDSYNKAGDNIGKTLEEITEAEKLMKEWSGKNYDEMSSYLTTYENNVKNMVANVKAATESLMYSDHAWWGMEGLANYKKIDTDVVLQKQVEAYIKDFYGEDANWMTWINDIESEGNDYYTTRKKAEGFYDDQLEQLIADAKAFADQEDDNTTTTLKTVTPQLEKTANSTEEGVKIEQSIQSLSQKILDDLLDEDYEDAMQLLLATISATQTIYSEDTRIKLYDIYTRLGDILNKIPTDINITVTGSGRYGLGGGGGGGSYASTQGEGGSLYYTEGRSTDWDGMMDYESWNDANSLTSTIRTYGTYAEGINAGAVRYTGMALLHGSPSNPEYVLTSKQMENFVQNMSRTPSSFANRKNESDGIVLNNANFTLNNVREPDDFFPALQQIAKQTRR